MQGSATYNLGFATAVCVVCAIAVSSAAVALRGRQDTNAALDKQRNVLVAAGLAKDGEKLDAAEIEKRFGPIQQVAVNVETGEEVPDFDVATYDQRKAAADPSTSRPAPKNPALVTRIPEYAIVYQLKDAAGALELVILPIEGKGLWSTLYGFVALGPDLNTVKGITFYEHKETPGLGGEVDNPRWKGLWPGRKIYGEDGTPRLEVIKGQAGTPEEDPYRVDGLAGATMTARGVSYLVDFWLGEEGFAPYLDRLRGEAS
jgi:Na+-transporting NADH:ubiquinone oxidoreductase subunit C